MGKEKVREVIVSLLLFFIAVNFLLSVFLHLYAHNSTDTIDRMLSFFGIMSFAISRAFKSECCHRCLSTIFALFSPCDLKSFSKACELLFRLHLSK